MYIYAYYMNMNISQPQEATEGRKQSFLPRDFAQVTAYHWVAAFYNAATPMHSIEIMCA